jgi:hypothetical protein
MMFTPLTPPPHVENRPPTRPSNCVDANDLSVLTSVGVEFEDRASRRIELDGMDIVVLSRRCA